MKGLWEHGQPCLMPTHSHSLELILINLFAFTKQFAHRAPASGPGTDLKDGTDSADRVIAR